MKPYWLLPLILIYGCSNADEKEVASKQSAECQINFEGKTFCEYQDYSVELKSKSIESDEIELVSLLVSYKQKKHELKLSDEISMLEGDIGFIYFADINFDGIPEPAITTSFGTANLYLDYWVYNSELGQFDFVGNHNQFEVDASKKTLKSTTRVNAATYESCSYSWKGGELVKSCE